MLVQVQFRDPGRPPNVGYIPKNGLFEKSRHGAKEDEGLEGSHAVKRKTPFVAKVSLTG